MVFVCFAVRFLFPSQKKQRFIEEGTFNHEIHETHENDLGVWSANLSKFLSLFFVIFGCFPVSLSFAFAENSDSLKKGLFNHETHKNDQEVWKANCFSSPFSWFSGVSQFVIFSLRRKNSDSLKKGPLTTKHTKHTKTILEFGRQIVSHPLFRDFRVFRSSLFFTFAENSDSLKKGLSTTKHTKHTKIITKNKSIKRRD